MSRRNRTAGAWRGWRRCSTIATASAVTLGAGCISADGRALFPQLAPLPPLEAFEDQDGDGLRDEEERALARRFAPIVLLHSADPHRPASVSWFADQTGFPERLGIRSSEVRSGSGDPANWASYVHVYPRHDGGLALQYWFFYPYNDGPLIFDHEADWEHATVRLDANRQPLGADLARHENDRPGRFVSWSALRREGDHPVVLSASGTHATYADRHDAAWYEQVPACEDLQACDGPVWFTWEGGGLVHVGERARPVPLPALAFPGRWGSEGILPGTSAPLGPLHHRGFCVAALPGCRSEMGGPQLAAMLPSGGSTPRK